MHQSLQGKIVLVTGSARRVGRGIALGLAAQGAHLVIHHHNSDAEAEQTAADVRALGSEALIVKGDHRQHADVTRNFAELMARFGRIDVLVNSASNFESGDLLDLPPEALDEALAVNLRAPFWCTQQAGRIMRDQQIAGAIINIGDNSGLRPWSARPQHSVCQSRADPADRGHSAGIGKISDSRQLSGVGAGAALAGDERRAVAADRVAAAAPARGRSRRRGAGGHFSGD